MEEEAKEGEATRSIGHRILPPGPATGHCPGEEFHHLQEKKGSVDAVGERKWKS